MGKKKVKETESTSLEKALEIAEANKEFAKPYVSKFHGYAITKSATNNVVKLYDLGTAHFGQEPEKGDILRLATEDNTALKLEVVLDGMSKMPDSDVIQTLENIFGKARTNVISIYKQREIVYEDTEC